MAITVSGALPRSQTEAFLRDCYDTLEPRYSNYVWSGWQSAIARLGLTSLEPLVREAFEQDFLDPSWLSFEHFQQDLAYAVAHPEAPVPPHDRDYEPFEDTTAELAHWYSFLGGTWSGSPGVKVNRFGFSLGGGRWRRISMGSSALSGRLGVGE